MRRSAVFLLVVPFLAVVAAADAQTPSGTPEDNPTGNAGALKAQIQTGGSYDAHSGNGTRIVNDLHVPDALGGYGLDFTRYWNSTDPIYDDPNAATVHPFGDSGWNHSWSWSAHESTWSQPLGSVEPVEEVFYTQIVITFPDGHTTKYKVTRSDRSHGTPPNVQPADPRLGPPYTSTEIATSWPDGGTGVHDHICNMAVDGSQFWLCRADGGSVHFVNGAATEVFDPHGFKTTLTYDVGGSLIHVEQEGGRFLDIDWGDFPGGYHVISQVRSGGPSGVQTVSYEYGLVGGYYRVLNKVRYEDEPTSLPAPNDKIAATYVYGTCFGDGPEPCSGAAASTLPLLKQADDPHFDGAMTVIRYKYVGTACVPPTMHPEFYPDFVSAQPSAIAMEKSVTGAAVSSFSIDCYGGLRREDNGLGGWRQFYYGTSAGTTESAPGGPFSCRGYQLGKLTDFTSALTMPANLPNQRQNFKDGDPRHIWDGRNLRTEATVAVGDDSGEPAVIAHADGSAIQFNRTNAGNSAPLDPGQGMHNAYNHWVFSKTDPLGRVTIYNRDGRRRVTRIDYPDGSAEQFAYNQFNQVTSHTLPSGAIITYTYDNSNGRLLSESNAVEGPDARKDYTYDSLGRVRTVSDGRARASSKEFSTRMTYNGRHKAVMIEYAGMLNSVAADNPHVTYGYDAYGNCTSITNELGATSFYTYDLHRRCTSYTEPLNAPDWNGGPSVASRRWDWIYDRYVEGLGLLDAYRHTANEWRVQIEPPFNAAGERRMTARWHDVNNRIVRVLNGWIQRAAPAALGDWYWSGEGGDELFAYDENGQKSTYTDSLGRTTTYEYDVRNRLTKTNETVNTVPRTTETLYDAAGNKTRVNFPVEAAGQRSQQWLEYDGFGQPGRFIDERGNTTTLSYKRWGPMKKLETVTTGRTKDGGGLELQATVFLYDDIGRATRIDFPDGTREESSYEYGQLKTWKTRKGQVKTIVYDARGRESSHTWNDAQTPGINRVWDLASRLSSINNNVSTIQYTYDDAAQVRTESNTISGAGGTTQLTYSRFPDGAVSRLQYPNGILIKRDYTARGQLKSVSDNVGNYWKQTVAYNYLPDGKVDYQDSRPGLRTDWSYDGRGFVSQVSTLKLSNNQELTRRTYQRDERDRITSFQKGNNPSVNPMEDGRGDHYWYDAEGQLTDAYYGAIDPVTNPHGFVREDHFSYDQLGNRMGWNWLASRGSMLLLRRDNGLNQYASWENNYPNPPQHWGSAVPYDDNFGAPYLYPGNGVTMGDGNVVVSYNALNQPRAAWVSGYGSSFLWFGYDPLGRCVKRWYAQADGSLPSGATYFVYDGWNLVQEGSNAATVSRLYFHGARVDEVVASYNAATDMMAYHYYDGSGHCTLLADWLGNSKEQYYYDAFGKPYFYNASNGWQAETGSSAHGNRFLFTGREWLSELKLYDYRNRMYQPELGRFLQPDPKHFAAGDYNLYRYCHNDPINHSDPMGLYVSGLTSFGGGEWIRGEAAITNREHDLITLSSRFPTVINDLQTSMREIFNAGPTTVGGTFGKRVRSQATTTAILNGATAEYLPDGRIAVSQSVDITTRYPTGNPSAELRSAELERRGAIIGWARDTYPDLVAPLGKVRYEDPGAASAAVDRAVRGSFQNYLRLLKVEFDFRPQGQDSL